MNTENSTNQASTGSARPSSAQKDTIEIIADTPEYMQRHGWKLAGMTSDLSILGEIKFSFQEEGCAVGFTWAKDGGDVIYWIYDGKMSDSTVSKTVSKSTRH